MKFSRIGCSGLNLSDITFGSALTIGTENDSEKYAEEMVSVAWELGIRSFDTSNNYGNAEFLLGKVLRKYPREEFVIATKGSWPIGSSIYHKGLSRKHIKWSFKRSLETMNLDYVDIYYAHRYDPSVPMEEIVRTFNQLIDSGQVLYWATSEWPLHALIECHEVCDKFGLEKPILDQFIYSYAINKADKNGIKEFCLNNGVGMLGFSPIAQGLLTGKYFNSAIPEGSRIAKSSKIGYDKTAKIYEQTKSRVDHFCQVCTDFNVKGSQAAIQWAIRNGVLPVLGASNSAQLIENVESVHVVFSDDFWEAIDSIKE
ncbi:aldo/keto reductase [Aeromonas hydrophila]|uniref:aldo/keto reductase n=1 Tax=Aeromonas hydrophila TaxID=644 RepID=UPI002F4177BD